MKVRFLIIDDTKSIHAFVRGLLGKSNLELEVVSVFNGKEAIDLLAKDSNFNLVLLDWEMPVMNGPETMLVLQGQFPAIPVMMMTTKNDPNDMMKMLTLGAKEYLLKPFTVDILFSKIESVIGVDLGKDVSHAA